MAENDIENTTDQNQAAAATAEPLAADSSTTTTTATSSSDAQASTAQTAPAMNNDSSATDATPEETAIPESTEEITYHAVEKDGQVSAIWEMQGRKHLRTIDPRSRQGQEILRLYTAEHHEETGADASAAAQ